MQKEFKVTVVSKQRCVVTVKANNPQEAEAKALDLVTDAPGDYFEPDYPDYDTESVIENGEVSEFPGGKK